MTTLEPAATRPLPPPPPAPDRSVAPRATGPLARWLCASGAVGLTAGGFAFLYRVDPNAAGNPYPRCLLKALTGVDCPGCGGTRAVYSLLHGDVAGAADHNVMVFLVLPVLAYALLRFVLARFEVDLPVPRMTRSTAWAFMALVIVFTVVRNIPVGPLWYLNSAAG